jgi:capsular polysaccharide export protein
MNYTVDRKRTFLFLQGSASWFFSDLGSALRVRGYGVRKINFNGGDVLFWPAPGAVNYRSSLKRWPEFLSAKLSDWAITDIILLGDCRPLHRKAIAVAAALQIPVYVFEEGYLRPNWITLERGGVNALSSLGRDPEWFMEAASPLPRWTEPAIAVNHMTRRAVEDILYVLATGLGAWAFPGYRSHRPWSSWTEYLGGARRVLRKPAAKRGLAALLDQLAQEGRPYYLLPLQLEADSQIRHHSRFGGIRPVIEYVIASFAASAPSDALLIVTEHPLDTSPFDWRAVVGAVARRHGVADRVRFFEGGSPERAIQGCRGVVTVNSTLGYLAISLGKPLIALGAAIYGLPGLTFQEALDRFWTEAAPPDPVIFDAFRRVVAARTQVNGSFYSRPGLRLAVSGSIRRLEAEASVLPAATRPTLPFADSPWDVPVVGGYSDTGTRPQPAQG